MSVISTEAIVQQEGGGSLKIEAITIPELRPEEALVEMHASGICHTDLIAMSSEFAVNHYPAVFGHEGSGVVLDVGSDVTGIAKGDKVLLSFTHCETCDQCTGGYPSFCYEFVPRNFSGKRPDGSAAFRAEGDGKTGQEVHGSFFGQSSFAKVSVVHRSSLVRVPQDTKLELFAPLGCGLMTGAGTVTNSLNVQEGESLLVFGCGGVGLAAIMAAKIRKANPIIAVDLRDSRLETARELGATHTINGSDTKDVVEEVKKICPPAGVYRALDASGSLGAIETMVRCLGQRGRAATVGGTPMGAEVKVDTMAHLFGGREYIGVCMGGSVSSRMIPWLMEQHAKGNFPIEKIIKYYDAKDVQKAIDDMHAGTALKPVLRWR